MPTRLTTLVLASVLTTLLGRTSNVEAQNVAAERRPMAEISNGVPVYSSGEYNGRKWHIDENHMMCWDGEPYVWFGFTGNGDLAPMLKAGFTQFTLAPNEEWPISGPDPKSVQSVNDTSDRLEREGATYYGTLNAFWPWRHGKLIAESDKAPVFVRDVRDVTDHAGRQFDLELEVRLPIPEAEQDPVNAERVYAVLFDLDHETRQDLSGQVEGVTPAEPGAEVGSERDDEWRGGKAFRVRLKPVRFPESRSLRLVIAMATGLAEVPGAHGLPPLWKPGIRQFYRRSLDAFRPAYAKPGLRGLKFGDEINTFSLSLLTARTYLDLRRDAEALQAYREWLAGRFGSIEQLNLHLSSRYASFDRVDWQVPLHPFAPGLARTDEAAEREESWAAAKSPWGLANTVEQLRAISRLQQEFCEWFYGHWLAEYAKLAKEVIGPVPVFVCSAAISGDADQYLAMHRWSLREGVDGLIRNHYGHAGEGERHTLASLDRWMVKVQRESGCTKHLWANEVGYVPPHASDDDAAAELQAGDSFGSQWAFPSRESLREMLVLLNDFGYRGFNRFLMNPSAPRSAREVEWMVELRPEIVALVVKTTGPPPAATLLSREQAIATAQRDGRVQQLVRGVESVRTVAEFSDRWDVWLVQFFAGDRQIAFASVSRDRKVLEVGPPETEGQERDNRRP